MSAKVCSASFAGADNKAEGENGFGSSCARTSVAHNRHSIIAHNTFIPDLRAPREKIIGQRKRPHKKHNTDLPEAERQQQREDNGSRDRHKTTVRNSASECLLTESAIGTPTRPRFRRQL